MDLKSIMFYLSQNGLSVQYIHFDIVYTFEPDTIGYSTLTLYLRDVRCAGSMDPEAVPDHDHKPEDTDQATLAALSEHLFTSIRELSRLTHVSVSVVHQCLIQSLHFRMQPLRWVHHFLTLD
jgi:hypothetical protein